MDVAFRHAVLWPGVISCSEMGADWQSSSACGQRGRNGQPVGASPALGAWPGMALSLVTRCSIEGSEAMSAEVYGSRDLVSMAWVGPSSSIWPAYRTRTRSHSCEMTA